MALAVDASSPSIAFTAGAGAATTGSFTPPVNALLVACVGGNQTGTTNGSVTWAMSSTGVTGLTWTTAVSRDSAENANTSSAACAITVAQLPGTVSAMTVTVTPTNIANSAYIGLYVVTGAASGSAAVGAVNEGGAVTTQPVTGTLTAQTNGSLIFGAASDWNANAVPTSTLFTEQGFDNGVALGAATGYAPMNGAGVGTTWDWSSTGPLWTWVVAEIKAVGASSTYTLGLPIKPIQVP